jgi:predicted nucleic acid-binding protein
VARADRTYVDPSALLKLYIHEPDSAAMSSWRIRTAGALPVTQHGRLEVANGICLAAFRKAISGEARHDALASLDEDFSEGRYALVDVLWRATLRRADEIARQHTATVGCRTLDVLHVATAVELGLRTMVTFDRRQQTLARATGLRVVAP